MNPLNLMLAQLDASKDLVDLRPRGQGFFDSTDSLIILAFIFLLAAALFSWAYFIRKRPRTQLSAHALVRSRRSHRSRHGPPRPSVETEERVQMRRRRRKRSEELPRNPTLGETGGLPPLRPEEPEDGTASLPQSSPPRPQI